MPFLLIRLIEKPLNRILCLSALLLASVFPAWAEPVPDLYAGEAVAESRDRRAVNAAARDALAQVLVKVSGNAAVLKQPAVSPILADASSLVEQYSFLDNAEDGSGVRMLFRFSGGAVVDRVKQAGAPVWTANRPAALAWVALRESTGERFVTVDTDPALSEALREAFSRRGVPLELPLFDLADTAAIRPEEVARLSAPAVELASRRYDSEDLLVGSLQPIGEGRLAARWRYLSAGEARDLKVPGADVAEVMDAAAGLVAEAMAARYAVMAADGGAAGVLISVVGVASYADYAEVLSWLESVELIESAQVVKVQGNRLLLRLVAAADPERLAGIIALNEGFSPVPSGFAEEQLSYRWQN